MNIDNICAVTFLFLKELNVKVNLSTLRKSIASHPLVPSMLAICDYFKDLKLNVEAFEVDKFEFTLANTRTPFIADFSLESGKYVLVHSIIDGEVTVSNDIRNRLTVPLSVFNHSWGGHILLAQPTPESGEKNYVINQLLNPIKKLLIPSMIVCLCTIFGYLYSFKVFEIHNLYSLLIKIAGLILTICLLLLKVNKDSSIGHFFCSPKKKSSCTAILNSESANLPSWLSWSEVGFIYFSGSFLLTLFFPSIIGALAIMNLIALPFTLYSLSYQLYTKKWCALCSSIQLVLMLDCLIYFKSYFLWSGNILPSLQLLPFLISGFILPSLMWYSLKPVFVNALLLSEVRKELFEFKYDNQLFYQLLLGQERFAINNKLIPVVFGNPLAKTTITIVSNPNCGPCRSAHQFLDSYIDRNKTVQAKLLFAVHNDLDTKIAEHIMALSLLNNEDIVRNAIKEWYKGMSIDKWMDKYPVKITEVIKSASRFQREWCEHANIAFTPTILINGHKLPELYNINDLEYLID